jgi:hypothetical protein
MAQVAQIESLINAAQKVIGGDVIFKVERVKQSLLENLEPRFWLTDFFTG